MVNCEETWIRFLHKKLKKEVSDVGRVNKNAPSKDVGRALSLLEAPS